ncbi:DNA/RNA non-specific endonuclease [Streptomyces antimycoticus]
MSREPLANPKAYNDRFLGTVVPLPVPADSGIETVILPYTDFSVVFRPDRRLAAATAVTINGANLIDVPRNDDWRFGPRLPEAQQAGHPDGALRADAVGAAHGGSYCILSKGKRRQAYDDRAARGGRAWADSQHQETSCRCYIPLPNRPSGLPATLVRRPDLGSPAALRRTSTSSTPVIMPSSEDSRRAFRITTAMGSDQAAPGASARRPSFTKPPEIGSHCSRLLWSRWWSP